jgi:hypothetical protein
MTTCLFLSHFSAQTQKHGSRNIIYKTEILKFLKDFYSYIQQFDYGLLSDGKVCLLPFIARLYK